MAVTKLHNKINYRTATDCRVKFRNYWDLLIPKGTACYYTAQGGFHTMAKPAFLESPQMRAQADAPGSMFKHDAEHFWIWLSPDDVEQVTKGGEA